MTITHDEKYQQFTIVLPNGDEAELAYAKPADKVMNFTHTFVPEAYRNQGLAEKLIKAGFAYAQENNLSVLPGCETVVKFLNAHPEYQQFLM
jgi:predicted GNAT family acetyltransferase